MKKLLVLNSLANTGSTGRISESIGIAARESGLDVKFGYGRKAICSQLPLIKIGNKLDQFWHGIESRLWDNHGFASRHATKDFIKKIDLWNPDIINLHNLHGYYLNVEILFEYLKRSQKPVVWTFHDCWPFTGHCAHYERVACYKWKTECHNCPNQRKYPASWIIDRSAANFRRKKKIFNGVNNLTIVTPSRWLAGELPYSFLAGYPVRIINNGIDLESFKPYNEDIDLRKKYELDSKPIILGVASTWKKKKAFDEFLKLNTLLGARFQIVLVGLKRSQTADLPPNFKAIPRTENVIELAKLYSIASVFLNPTYVDNFPTTNIEALACGTPVITYVTGGSAEAIDRHTGIAVKKGDLTGLKSAIEEIILNGKINYSKHCRTRAEQLYNKEDRYQDYVSLFRQMLT